jgi:hypothetical protein
MNTLITTSRQPENAGGTAVVSLTTVRSHADQCRANAAPAEPKHRSAERGSVSVLSIFPFVMLMRTGTP